MASKQPSTEDTVRRIFPEEPNPEILDILGRPNFQCAHIAHVLRLDGHKIPYKAEMEQGHVIHWCVCLYLKHGDHWREAGEQELRRIKAAKGSSKT